MAVFFEKMPMVGQSKGQRRLRPERNIHEAVLLRHRRRPRVKSVGHQQVVPVGIAADDVSDELVGACREIAHDDPPVVLEVEVAVELQGEAVADGGVADVETRAARLGEGVGVAGAGVGAELGDKLVVDGFEVGEGDGEALGGEGEG